MTPDRRGGWQAVFRTDLREVLRDRRTLFINLVLPALLYPLLTLVLVQVSQIAAATPRPPPRVALVGEDGETHHGLYDISWSRCLPGLALLAPKDGAELRAMLRWAHTARQQPDRLAGYCIRYPRDEAVDRGWGTPPVALGKAEILRRGDAAKPGAQVMIWAYGTLVDTCWRALEALGDEAAGVTLVNARFAKPLDTALLAELAATHTHVLTAEDHALPGGFGSIVTEAVGDLDLDLRVTRLGVRDELVPHASRARQLSLHGLDQAGVTAALRRLLTPATAAIPFRRPAAG